MNKTVIIIGASGHGKVIADIVKRSGDIVRGFLDDNPNLSASFVGYPILGNVDEYERYVDSFFIVGIGDASVREKIVHKLRGVSWYTAIHPTAVISDVDTYIADGTVIMANVVINAGAEVGEHCIINSGAIVEHDNIIEEFSHISVGAKLAGAVHVGRKTWIGIGAVVNNNLYVCSECVIGAGAVVIKNVVESGTYIGVPAVRKY